VAISVPVWLALLVAAPFIGSFLGTVILRSDALGSLVTGRSACESCKHPLGPADLVPIVSFVAAQGRCRYCGARLGLFYPAVELAAVVPVAWSAFYLDGWLLVASAVLGWTLIALAWIDWRTLRLPDVLTLPLLIAGLMAAYAFDRENWLGHLLGCIGAYAAFAAIAFLYERARGREGLGMGDAKLAAAIGAWISWDGAASAVLIAALLALCAILARRIAGHPISGATRIPFGPFLAAGAWIVWLYGPLVPAWA
jgi:leader peptidase (prepilin peptidase)/N-methyltransferase